MSSTDCYYDESGCLVCPEIQAVQGHPSYNTYEAIIGWNAGANSIDAVDGDLHVVFDMPLGSGGIVLGLKTDRARQTLPALIEHGWYFQSLAGFDCVQVVEGGQTRTEVVERDGSEMFEIRRVNGQVRYLRNGDVVYVSQTPSTGAKIVNCCMYVSGDQAPGG